MDKITFTIENKEFSVPLNYSEINSFEVKSVPRPYNVVWKEKEKPFETINRLINKNENSLLLIDNNVFEIHKGELEIPQSRIFRALATENFKTLQGVTEVIEFLAKHQFTKGETLIVVGGGIIQDVGAFVGACFKRGIPWIYVPTTLLSMCDSCIGGKTGINHNNAKNQLALFSAPSRVVINPEFLKTLEEKEIKSGLGEILKLSITGGKEFVENYSKYTQNGMPINFDAFKPLILGALWVKKAIVEEDEFELNHRRSLNYGHTLGHVVEVLSEYKITHGLAVAIGIIIVNEMSCKRSILSTKENDFLNNLCFDLLNEGIMKGISTESIAELLKKDKKTLRNTVNLVIIESAGNTRILPVELNSELSDEISQIIRRNF